MPPQSHAPQPRPSLPALLAYTSLFIATSTANPPSSPIRPNDVLAFSSAIADRRHLSHPHAEPASLAPRALSGTDLVGGWRLVVKEWEAIFAPSSAGTVRVLSDFYASIFETLVRDNRSEISSAETLSFTYGALRMSLRAVGRAVPWDVGGVLLKRLRELTWAGLTGLFSVAVWFLKGMGFWSVIVVVLMVWQRGGEDVVQNVIT